VQTGGGVRSSDDVKKLVELGAARMVVGTKAIEDWKWFEELAHRPELAGKLVLALDARDGVVATRGWTQTSGLRAVDVAAKISGWPVAAILYTDVSKDGMLGGPNYSATRQLAEAGKVLVIASGGVGNIEHIRKLCELPVWGAIIGRSLYEGTLDLREAIKVAAGG
jgi:phosphoribosylformimino-5-aminoimidazole carboxamide ribotide isomerase